MTVRGLQELQSLRGFFNGSRKRKVGRALLILKAATSFDRCRKRRVVEHRFEDLLNDLGLFGIGLGLY